MSLFLLPLMAAMVGGFMLAGEAEKGTMRTMLLRPVRRGSVLMAKWVTGMLYLAVVLAMVLAAGIISGWAFFGIKPMLIPGAVVSIWHGIGLTVLAYLVATRGHASPKLVSLRNDVDLDAAIPLDRSAAWKHLDVAVLQELILDPILAIHPDRPESLDRLGFVKDAHGAFAQTANHDVVFVLRPTRMDQLRSVALAGETMPQKSTYFYPKLLSGLVFRSAE